jgi:folate-binding protein YgfZ
MRAIHYRRFSLANRTRSRDYKVRYGKDQDPSMNKAFYAANTERGLLALAGEDRVAFLQGLISNDARRLSPSRALYALLLTPQGKFLFDLILAAQGERILIEGERPRLSDLMKRLSLYKLRSKVALADAGTAWASYSLFGAEALSKLGLGPEPGAAKILTDGIVFTDPRLPALGARAFLKAESAEGILTERGFTAAAPETYRALRLSLGVPENSGDLIPEKSIPLECGMDELNAVDWDKGCYMGQELTARTRYRGLVRKRLFPVKIEGTPPAPGAALKLGETEAGELRVTSADGGVGLALLRLEHLDAAMREGLSADSARVIPMVPDWMKLPQTAG